jgi:hypothetical protein
LPDCRSRNCGSSFAASGTLWDSFWVSGAIAPDLTGNTTDPIFLPSCSSSFRQLRPAEAGGFPVVLLGQQTVAERNQLRCKPHLRQALRRAVLDNSSGI